MVNVSNLNNPTFPSLLYKCLFLQFVMVDSVMTGSFSLKCILKFEHHLDTFLLHTHGFCSGLTLSDLRARYLKLQRFFVSPRDAASYRVFREAFGESCCSGYVCFDAVLGRCMLAVCMVDGGPYVVFDGLSSGEDFLGNDDCETWVEVTAVDEGGGIVRIQSVENGVHLIRVAKDVSQLLYRTKNRGVW